MTTQEMKERALTTLAEIAAGVPLDGVSPPATDRIQAAIVLMQLSLEEE